MDLDGTAGILIKGNKKTENRPAVRLRVNLKVFQPLRVLQNLDVKEKDKDENIFIKLSRD